MSVADPPRWIPDRIVVDSTGESRCHWADLTGIRVTDPFFESTLSRRESRLDRWSTVGELYDEAATVPEVADLTFIFHVSRCGSTLLSQLFCLHEGMLVFSEAPLLDEILNSDRPDREALFIAALRLLGRLRAGAGDRIVVKTDCWHVFHAARLRRLYPQARFVLLHRRPAAVLASHQKARGMQMVPGALAHAPFDVQYDPERMSLDQYAALVLERIYAAMLEIATVDERSLLVSYEEGFPELFLRVADWLALSPDAGDLQRIHERCAYHGKRPGDIFVTETLPSPPPAVDLQSLESLFSALQRHSKLEA
jgi:hypothetical protein